MFLHSLISSTTIPDHPHQATRARPRGRPLLKDWRLKRVRAIGAGAFHHEERFGRDSRDPVTLATETLSLLIGDEPPSLRPACPEVPSTKRMCVLGPSSELVADGASVMGLVTCTPVIAVAAALRKAEAASAARERPPRLWLWPSRATTSPLSRRCFGASS